LSVEGSAETPKPGVDVEKTPPSGSDDSKEMPGSLESSAEIPSPGAAGSSAMPADDLEARRCLSHPPITLLRPFPHLPYQVCLYSLKCTSEAIYSSLSRPKFGTLQGLVTPAGNSSSVLLSVSSPHKGNSTEGVEPTETKMPCLAIDGIHECTISSR